MTARVRLLLLGAFPPEIAPLAGLLPADVVARTCGVGLVEAALGAAQALRETGAGGVVFVGTCGAFRGAGLRVGEVVALDRATLADASAARGDAALPEPMRAEVLGDPALTAALAPGRPRVVVATTLAVTTSDAAADALERSEGAAVEHLEAFAVGRAAARVGVPFAALLGVANAVGASGRAEWRTHHAAASKAAAEVLLAGLGARVWRPLLQSQAPTTL